MAAVANFVNKIYLNIKLNDVVEGFIDKNKFNFLATEVNPNKAKLGKNKTNKA